MNSHQNIESPDFKTLLYKITTVDGKVNHIYGMAHISDLDVVRIPLELKTAFENATTCLVENNPDHNEDEFEKWKTYFQEKEISWMTDQQIYWKGESFEKYVEYGIEYCKEQYKKLGFSSFGAWDEMIFKNQVLGSTPINFAFNILAGAESNFIDSEEPIFDVQIVRQAKLLNKKIIYVESEETGVNLAYGFNFNYQQHLDFFHHIHSYVKNGGKKLDASNAKENYLSGDLILARNSFCGQVFSELLENGPAIIKSYVEDIGEKRDIAAAKKIKPYLDIGNSCTFMGSAHLLGILTYLKKDGYQIEPVKLSERKYAIADCKPQNDIKFHSEFFKLNLEKTAESASKTAENSNRKNSF
jgi:uncharacterized protein YbaP (TraB family)